MNELQNYMHADMYGWSQVTSLYFDTPHREIIGRSMEKPLYKEKIRLRTYKDFSLQSQVFLELKKKYKGIVYKRRVTMSYAAARAFIAGMDYSQAVTRYPLSNEEEQCRELDANALQIAREIRAAFNRYPQMQESMEIRCNRCAFVSNDQESIQESDLRITFDTDIAYQSRMSSCVGELLPAGYVLMEVKTSLAYPLWLVRVLTDNDIFPTSFSKYGKAYEQETTLVGGVFSGAAARYYSEIRNMEEADVKTRKPTVVAMHGKHARNRAV